ncbi:unnamed protein product [Aureobasidium uvarum]|uniref:Uncharacterized protein n=1 Tax=Aureobasidium uvarum TaxID=2773716 RepID=A0A9N8PV95_9PEZI|nr:unnamed protein product [Aureobasidium uvarum]
MARQKKAAVAPATPKAGSGDEAPVTPATEVKKTPRKRAPAKVFNKLSTALSSAAPVDVTFENDTVQSKPLAKDANHGQTVRLVAAQPFELVASCMLDNGLQAIIIKPSAPFPFMKLPKILRTRILSLNLAPTTKGRIEIVTESKSGSVKTKDYSKEFKEDAHCTHAKHRVAIAQLNKEIAVEARQILYSYKLRFDSTTTLLNFLSLVGEEARKAMSTIAIVSYIKATAMPCMNMLADCRNLEKVVIVGGVGTNSTPQKTAKSFFTESGRLLQTLVHAADGNKDAALNIVTFGKKCFSIKEEDKLVDWDQEQTDEFTELITDKLK